MTMIKSQALVDLIGAANRNNVVIANNIANANTPGYRTLRVGFADALDRALTETGELRSGRRLEARVYRADLPAGQDGNNVRVEREIVEMNKTSLRIKLYLNVLGSRIQRMRAAIEGR